MSYQAVEQKKDDFRKYLDKNGVVDALTNALIGLYEESEKPEEPLQFILTTLQNASGKEDVQTLKLENEQLKHRISELEQKIAEFQQQQQQLNSNNTNSVSNEAGETAEQTAD